MQRQHAALGWFARLGLDLSLTATMLALFSFGLTGLTLHEWLGLAICVLVPVHLLVSWRWLTAISRRLMSPLPWRTRLTYLLNALSFISVVVVTLTGLVISEVLFRNVFPQGSNRGFWHMLHSQSSNATLLLMAIHLGIYGRQLIQIVRRVGGTARRRLTGAPDNGAGVGGSHPAPRPRAIPAMTARG